MFGTLGVSCHGPDQVAQSIEIRHDVRALDWASHGHALCSTYDRAGHVKSGGGLVLTGNHKLRGHGHLSREAINVIL